jgi:hypothetical protein
MPATHEVLRERMISGKVREKGELIDASKLRTTDLMVRQRHLRPLTYDEQRKLAKPEKEK